MSKDVQPKSPVEYRVLALDPEISLNGQPRWRPTSLRRAALVATVFTLFALLCLVVLSQYQQFRQGAVLVASTVAGLSESQIFFFKYLPTTLIVLFGVWISVIDLDIKRLEPYYQLSQNERHKHPPLLCAYDTDFFLTVLIRSLHRRQIVVFSTSVLFILTTMVIPAVQNSMLLPRNQIQTRNVHVSQTAALVNTTVQTTRMSYNVLTTAYSMCWLGQDDPAYITRHSSFAPFEHSLNPDDTVATSLQVPTTRYWAELNCWKPASVHVTANSSETYARKGFTASFDDGRGCNTSNLLLVDESVAFSYDADYEAYYFAASSEGFASPGPSLGQACPQFPDLFLAVYRVRGLDYLRTPDFGPNGNATAMFCEPKYYSEPVMVTVATNNYSILSYHSNGDKQLLLQDLFNQTHFEYLLALGYPPIAAEKTDLDIGDKSVVIQTTRLKNASLSAPNAYSSDNMVGYLLGASQYPSKQYLDFDVLKDGYEQAYQLLFALSMSQNFGANPQRTQEAVLGSMREVVALVSGFAIATEVLFCLAILACVYLLINVPARMLRLVRDPDSLKELMMLARDTTIQQTFEDLSSATNRELEDILNPRDFKFYINEKGLSLPNTLGERHPVSSIDANLNTKDTSLEVAKNPPEMSRMTAEIMTFLITASILTFIVLRYTSIQHNGLVLPSSSEFVNQLLLNFLPTIFASLLGGYLSLFCRTSCFLTPFQDLKKGGASASVTLQASYNSSPAPLVFAKALSGGHYLLAALSIIAILSHVLTVSLAGIFIRRDVTDSTRVFLYSKYKPFVLQQSGLDDSVESSSLDSFYPVVTNSSNLTNLPTWTTHSYGYLPSTQSGLHGNDSTSEIEYESLGYGADFECIDLLTPSINATSLLEFRNQGMEFLLSTKFITSQNTSCECSLNFDDSLGNANTGDGFGPIGGSLSQQLSSMEIVKDYQSGDGIATPNGTFQVSQQCDFCAQRIVFGWVRGHLVPTQSVSANLTATGKFEYNATIIACTPRMKTQYSLLRISPNGHVVKSTTMGVPNYNLDPSINLTASFNTSIDAMWNSILGSNRTWHTDTITRDMSNYLFKKIRGNSSLLDPLTPPPSVDEASNLVSDALSRIFATQLFIDRPHLQAKSPSPNKLEMRDDSIPHKRQNSDTTSNTTTTNAPDSPDIEGTGYFQTKRIFVSLPMFIISISILTFDLIVLLLFRFTLPAPFLPRMPFTIASQIAFFAGSRVVDDVLNANGDLKKLDERGYRYAYGKYIGKHGALCIGIEREEFVTKLRRDDGEVRRRNTTAGWREMFSRRRRGDTKSYQDLDGQELVTLQGRWK